MEHAENSVQATNNAHWDNIAALMLDALEHASQGPQTLEYPAFREKYGPMESVFVVQISIVKMMELRIINALTVDADVTPDYQLVETFSME